MRTGESANESERVERFLGAYNTLDAHLQNLFSLRERDGATGHQSFRSLVDWLSRREPWWPHAETLRLSANLRNILVHETYAPQQYPCVPSWKLVEEIERVRDELLHPERALPRFERRVELLQGGDSLRRALQVMHERGFGVLPVYETKQFRGVFSETLLARWLAAQSASNCVDLDNARVREVLKFAAGSQKQSRRRVFQWMDAQSSVQEIAHQFHQNTWLETVLISKDGHDNQPLQGIVTRADVWRWEWDHHN